MKFTAATFTLAGLVALAAAAPQAETTSAPMESAPPVTSAPVSSYSVSVDPVYSSVLACISKCPAGDVICQAKCQGLPVPDEGAVNATHDCIAACPPGGDDEKNAAWAVCQQKCVTSLYWTASITWTGSVALPTDDAEPTDGNSNGGDPTATGEDGAEQTGGNSENPSQTSGGSNPSQTPNAASSMLVNIPLLGALFLGALAL